MTNEIKATAPTPQDWIELVRENEILRCKLNITERAIDEVGLAAAYRDLLEQLVNNNSIGDLKND